MANWSAADWAGVIGACAWVPIIISFIKSRLTKPKLNIILHREAELGYTTFGPIFNVSMALSAENAESLVNKIEIDIQGPNQEKHRFAWDWFEERFYDIEYTEIGSTPVTKRQNAVAIKVAKEGIAERKIGYSGFVNGGTRLM
ncbi:hypothetical protein [Hymenobacter elongatus]|uniref:Uncharacterized protein n=1 Tax=Hymenobacter elongatus TaxID=877208 RepID=A0A4Z0PQD3_9BACT|nr:hypothetical protein [Hymenobacter elongatus]TGE19303.1 hypothetical protein E5J99_03420 [Hymenobacter elongatus]